MNAMKWSWITHISHNLSLHLSIALFQWGSRIYAPIVLKKVPYGTALAYPSSPQSELHYFIIWIEQIYG